MSPIFKDGSAKLDQAIDLARRGEFVKASERFREAAAKLAKEGSVLNVSLANAYADLMLFPSRGNDPTYLLNLAAFLRASLGATELRPGPRGIAAFDLATQLELAAKETTLLAAVSSGAGDRAALAQSIQGLAMEYRQLGDQVLFLPELFNNQAVQSESKFPVLMAISFEVLGTSLQSSDPLGAAEHFQSAQQYWIQFGDEARANASGQQVENLALRAKCWFCGREGAGHGIQFVSLPIDQDVHGLTGGDSSPLPSLDKTGRHVFACKGCSSALRTLADRIAVQRAGEVEIRLRAEIEQLERRLQSQISTQRR